jgi:NAD(P)-dependent dehydrogenase (short-subunit alcohol dehydrogenase family)
MTDEHLSRTPVDIAGAVALVTGANRGLGRHLAAQLLDRGATVYAAARTPDAIDLPGVRRLRLDVIDAADIAAAVTAAPDVTLLVNNAGISRRGSLLDDTLDDLHAEMATNAWAPLHLARAFAPTLAANGGGAIVNVLSALSWFATAGASDYHVSKAAGWAVSNGLRLELAGQGTHVLAVHPGAFDTDMMAGYDGPLGDPADIARAVLDGLAEGRAEVLADDWSRFVKGSLTDDPERFYGRLAQLL